MAGGPQKHSFFNLGTATVSAFAEPALEASFPEQRPASLRKLKKLSFCGSPGTAHRKVAHPAKEEVLRIKKIINDAIVDFADRVKI